MAHRFTGINKIQWVHFDPKPYQKLIRKVANTVAIKVPKLSQDFIMLAATANYLQNDLDKKLEGDIDLWKNSPFEWVLKLPPARKGKLGGDLIASWLASQGLHIDTTADSTKTIVLNKHKVSLKFSTLWANGIYKFQQIRSSGYEFVLCFGISPFGAHCWVFEKEYILNNASQQHKGAQSAEYWITIDPNNPPNWAVAHGGTLDEALPILKKIKPKK